MLVKAKIKIFSIRQSPQHQEEKKKNYLKKKHKKMEKVLHKKNSALPRKMNRTGTTWKLLLAFCLYSYKTLKASMMNTIMSFVYAVHYTTSIQYLFVYLKQWCHYK